MIPHNLEAEQAYLGAVLVNNACMTDIVKPEHFIDAAHQKIYQTIVDKISEGKNVTPISPPPTTRVEGTSINCPSPPPVIIDPKMAAQARTTPMTVEISILYFLV